MKRLNKKGFTLIETLVSVSILSIIFTGFVSVAVLASGIFIRSNEIRTKASEAFSKAEEDKPGQKENGSIEILIDGQKVVLDVEYDTYTNSSSNSDYNYYSVK